MTFNVMYVVISFVKMIRLSYFSGTVLVVLLAGCLGVYATPIVPGERLESPPSNFIGEGTNELATTLLQVHNTYLSINQPLPWSQQITKVLLYFNTKIYDFTCCSST